MQTLKLVLSQEGLVQIAKTKSERLQLKGERANFLKQNLVHLICQEETEPSTLATRQIEAYHCKKIEGGI